ncbi:hypothetical protein GCM10010172_75880 [Paractinoplanes ferrugineus]|uniref:Uncharacterized protein n=1 Tax=Paractinoplanes ferrugineus TaxID=113564 RepID=A0A919J0Q8_9ACTN|nr:hypothetical protein [Actinoplanes ferrugineus]GIE11257.1 hypothetical protein Afe05nite_30970 [Actinoplanes ferrugineus]
MTSRPEDLIRAEMRQALAGRRPDRTAMLNRIAANRAAESTPRPVARRARPGTDRAAGAAGGTLAAAGHAFPAGGETLPAGEPFPAGGKAVPGGTGRTARLVGAALAVVTVLGLGGVARWALADSPDRTPAAPPPATAPANPVPSSPVRSAPIAGAPTSGAPASGAPAPGPLVSTEPVQPSAGGVPTRPSTGSATTAPVPAASPVRGHPGDTQVQKGTLWSDGSVESSGNSVVTLRPGAGLTELDLTIHVIRTPGLTSLGAQSSTGAVAVTVTEQPGTLLYRFTLKPGATLGAGEYRLTARWGGGERDAGDDTYEAYATSTDHKRLHVYGNFFPA